MISHLTSLHGTDVTINGEIDSANRVGIPDASVHVQGTARTPKFTDHCLENS